MCQRSLIMIRRLIEGQLYLANEADNKGPHQEIQMNAWRYFEVEGKKVTASNSSACIPCAFAKFMTTLRSKKMNWLSQYLWSLGDKHITLDLIYMVYKHSVETIQVQLQYTTILFKFLHFYMNPRSESKYEE